MKMKSEIIDWIYEVEGGYTNDSVDRGGETNLGITHQTLQEAYNREIVDITDVKKLTEKDSLAIYEEMFYLDSHAETLEFPLDWVHFDTAVNSGNGRAIKLLQQTCNDLGANPKLVIDGSWGPRTYSTVNEISNGTDAPIFAYVYLLNRAIYLNKIIGNDKSQLKYINGWLNRITKLKNKIA